MLSKNIIDSFIHHIRSYCYREKNEKTKTLFLPNDMHMILAIQFTYLIPF
jgi:hypothetical protein